MITPRFFCFVSGAPEVSCGTEGGGGGLWMNLVGLERLLKSSTTTVSPFGLVVYLFLRGC